MKGGSGVPASNAARYVLETKAKCESSVGVECWLWHILKPPTCGRVRTIELSVTTPPEPPATRALIAPLQSGVTESPKGKKTTVSPLLTASPLMVTVTG